MLKMRYIGESALYRVDYEYLSPNIIQIKGEVPFKPLGFELYKDSDDIELLGIYDTYTTLYRPISGGYQISNDGSVYVPPPEPTPPEPYVPTLEEVIESKVQEMNNIQQAQIANGVDVTLSDGTTERFTLTDADQRSLTGLQTKVAAGDERIPWHIDDESVHCKYYSNADMAKIVDAAFGWVTYHVTYFRDLRIYIRSLTTKEEVQAVTYGMDFPEQYKSQPLKDMQALAAS